MFSKIVPITLLICFAFMSTAYSHVGKNIPVKSSKRGGKRIIGGEVVVDPDAWPWMAALVTAGSSPPFRGMQCGATLIGSRWILTAAHCVENIAGGIEDPESLEVILGSQNLNDGYQWDRVKVKRIIQHPYYDDSDDSTPDFDVAIIELEEEKSSYGTIELYTDNSSLKNRSAKVIGWGSTSEWGEPEEEDPYQLRQLTVDIISNSDCQNATNMANIDSSMLCAGIAEGDKSPCYGDSGGPLIVNEDGVWKQAGVVNFGTGFQCAEKGSYGVYARVSEIQQFIDDAKTGIFLSGQVTTSYAGNSLPVQEATVSINETYFQTRTGYDGRFKLLLPNDKLLKDSYQVTVQGEDFEPVTQIISVKGKKGDSIVLELSVLANIEKASRDAYDKGYQKGLADAKLPTLSSDFSLKIPHLRYSPKGSEKHFWLDLRFVPENGRMLFEIKGYGNADIMNKVQ